MKLSPEAVALLRQNMLKNMTEKQAVSLNDLKQPIRWLGRQFTRSPAPVSKSVDTVPAKPFADDLASDLAREAKSVAVKSPTPAGRGGVLSQPPRQPMSRLKRRALQIGAWGGIGAVGINAASSPDDLATLDRAGFDRRLADGADYSNTMWERAGRHPLSTLRKLFADNLFADYKTNVQRKKELDDIIRAETQKIRTQGVRSGGNFLTNLNGYVSDDRARKRLKDILNKHYGDGDNLPLGAVNPLNEDTPIKLNKQQQQDYLSRIRLNLQMAQNNSQFGGSDV